MFYLAFYDISRRCSCFAAGKSRSWQSVAAPSNYLQDAAKLSLWSHWFMIVLRACVESDRAYLSPCHVRAHGVSEGVLFEGMLTYG